MKKIIYILIFLLITSCVAKKTTVEYKERIVKDTVSVFKDRIISKQVIDTLLVESPCDTLGNLKDFEKTIKTDKASVVLKNVKGNIQVEVNIDSIVDIKIKEFKSSYKKEVDVKEVEIVKFRYPLWMILAIIILALLNVVQLKSKLPF